MFFVKLKLKCSKRCCKNILEHTTTVTNEPELRAASRTLRQQAKKAGWKRGKGTADYCPNCREEAE
jgi:hypothetical protein